MPISISGCFLGPCACACACGTMLQDPRPYLDDFQVVAQTARAAAHQVSTAAPAVAQGAVRVSRAGAKAARRTRWLWKPTLWVMAPLRHAAVRRLLDDREPVGKSACPFLVLLRCHPTCRTSSLGLGQGAYT
ncbi:hypothetical protein Vretifemale_14913 [Volvox reticuliferus]|uniref:Uncharacterized protein n=1 Tax=Volvox reticuliferus TaxID=1737510 RepID=A0A8J4CU22_9CHLO|nr:hypothetical protein Vretifemale_14913 [Volvox reticuliferus]